MKRSRVDRREFIRRITNSAAALGAVPPAVLAAARRSVMRAIDCSQVALPYGPALVSDVLNRTDTAMSQEHCYRATELMLIAQKRATRVSFKA